MLANIQTRSSTFFTIQIEVEEYQSCFFIKGNLVEHPLACYNPRCRFLFLCARFVWALLVIDEHNINNAAAKASDKADGESAAGAVASATDAVADADAADLECTKTASASDRNCHQ